MSAPVNYQILFEDIAIKVERVTTEINTALNKIESYNLRIKVCEVKGGQLTQIAANLTESVDFDSTEAVNDIGRATKVGFEIEDIVSERSKLENSRQTVLDSVDQALQCLEGQRDIADNLAMQIHGEHHWYEFYRHALLTIARWDVDMAVLKSRRDLVGQTI